MIINLKIAVIRIGISITIFRKEEKEKAKDQEKEREKEKEQYQTFHFPSHVNVVVVQITAKRIAFPLGQQLEIKPIKGNPPAQNPFYQKGGQQQQQYNQGGRSETNKLLKTVNTLVNEIKNQQSINAAIAQPAPAADAAPQGNSQGIAQVPLLGAPRG